MSPSAALLGLAALIAVSAAIGLLLRRTGGRIRRTADDRLVGTDVGTAEAFGDRATLVQFSTAFCAQCPGTARLLGELAAARPGVAHVEVDLGAHPEVADRFGVLQTPTTLLLDRDGRLRARIGGAPRRPALEQELDDVLEGTAHVR